MSSPLEIVASVPGATSQLLYFTSPSVSADGTKLLFVREQNGNPDIWVHDLETRSDRALTANRDGVLKSYVYFRGTPHRGLSKASICHDHSRGRVYARECGRTFALCADDRCAGAGGR